MTLYKKKETEMETTAPSIQERTRTHLVVPGQQFSALLQLIPDKTPKGVALRIALERRDEKLKAGARSYAERKKLQKTMKDINEGLSSRALNLMNRLAVAMDDDDTDTLQENMFNPDNKDSMMEVIADLLFIANHTEITPPQRDGGNGSRLTRAETLARAHSPEWVNYGFCPKCNRPMLKSYIKEHQRHSKVCIEIKQGKIKAIEIGKAKDFSIGTHIAESMFYDMNDSDDE